MSDVKNPKPGTPEGADEFLNSADFAKEEYRHPWRIDKILVAGQPGVIGGAMKTLKTSIAIDMAISLGTGTPFLGKFRVPKQVRVALLSGESGKATVLETALRICKMKKVRLENCEVTWSFRLPSLSDPVAVKRLINVLREKRIKVVIIDPLYLCLLSGNKTASASNLYDIGPILHQVVQACLAAGATPIFIHHAIKSAGKSTARSADKQQTMAPMGLGDLAFAGIGEFVRQWILIGRREPYNPGSGSHQLHMSVGGSAGHSSVWNVDVHEGVLDDDGTERRWNVAVRSPGAAGVYDDDGELP